MPDVVRHRYTRDILLELSDPDRRLSTTSKIAIDRVFSGSGLTIPTRLTPRRDKSQHRQYAANYANLTSVRSQRAISRKPQKAASYRGVNASNLVEIRTVKALKSTSPKLPSIYMTNCRSLNQPKLDELRNIATTHSPELICLTETWLDDAKTPQTTIQGYSGYFSNRTDRIGGGVAMFVPTYMPVTLLSSFTTTTVSSLWLLVQVSQIRSVIVATVYHPPRADESTTLEHIEASLARFTLEHPNASIILTGDFNRLPLDNILAQFNLLERVNFATCGTATLDNIYTNADEYQQADQLAPISTNDHCGILLHGQPLRSARYIRIKRRVYTSESRERILLELTLEDWSSVLQSESLDTKVESLHCIITRLLDLHAPYKTIKAQLSTIQKLIRARDQAFKRGCPSWVLLRRLVQRKISTAKRTFVRDELNKVPDSKRWWCTLKQLMNGDTTKSNSTSLTINNKRLSTEELCENLNSYFSSVGGDLISRPVNVRSSNSAPLDTVSIGEVKRLLSGLDTTKSTSSSDFPTWISKEGREDICIPLHDIVNSMLGSSTYPSSWKCAEIRPIPKVPSPRDPKDFRPISLLFHLGKLCEQVIINKLSHTIRTSLSRNQYAYQQGFGTTDALIHLIDDWTRELDKRSSPTVKTVCLDFSKAFDRLQRDVLIAKLHKLNVNTNLIAIISHFLTGRKQCVKVETSSSTTADIKVGTPQGTKLGPALWLIYVDDLLENSPSSCVKYADDTTVYHTQHAHVETSLRMAETWSEQNSMALNASKTIVMELSLTSRSNAESLELNLLGDRLETSNVAKFLGVHIDSRLTFNVHIQKTTSKCSSRLYFMRLLRRMGLSNDGLLTFYKANIRSVLTYACPAWKPLLSKLNCDRLEQIQRSATRIILPELPYDERCQSLKLVPLCDFIDTQCTNHFISLSSTPSHPLYPRLTFNNARRSGRSRKQFRPATCRTSKYKSSFLQHFMAIF